VSILENQYILQQSVKATRYAVIVAGGSGRRMGSDVPKQFIEVGGIPILMRTIMRFKKYSNDVNVILVLPMKQQKRWIELCKLYHFGVSCKIVNGGATRFESSQKGIEAIPANARGLVAIHDGVRPFVSVATIKRCFDAAQEVDAVIPVMPVVDTLRHIDSANEGHNVLRSDYRIVQTPQVFDITVARVAFQQSYSETFTDDASVVEKAGTRIAMVEGNKENIKITTPFDLIMADVLAKMEARG